MTDIRHALLLLSLLLILGGCSDALVISSETPVHVVGGVDTTGLLGAEQPVAFSQLIAQLMKEDIVYIGERHDNHADHRIQLAVIQSLHRSKGKLAIGLEWFQRPFQQHLDDFINGDISETEMLRRTQYFARWGIDYRHYRPIIRYARDNDIPLVALNAPSELVHAIMQGGLKSLDDLHVEQLPDEYYFTNREYKNRLRSIHRQHKDFRGPFSNFYEVQLTWDETMAEQASRYLGLDDESILVVLAGNGHLEYGDGIPDRVERRTGIIGKTLLPYQPDTDDREIADYVLSTPQTRLPTAGLLGAILRHGPQQPIVVELDRSGPARRAGLRKGDRIIRIEDREIRDLTDLRLALLDKPPGARINIEVRSKRASKRSRLLELILDEPSTELKSSL